METARTRAVFQVCRAATATSMVTSTALGSTGPGGVPRPVASMRGTESWATPTRMSAASPAINDSAFLFVASGMPLPRLCLAARTIQLATTMPMQLQTTDHACNSTSAAFVEALAFLRARATVTETWPTPLACAAVHVHLTWMKTASVTT